MDPKGFLEREIDRWAKLILVISMDSNFACPQHYNSYSRSIKFQDIQCPICKGLGMRNSAYVTKGRIDDFTSPSQYLNNETPGNLPNYNMMAHFPISSQVKEGDIIAECHVSSIYGRYEIGAIQEVYEIIDSHDPQMRDNTLQKFNIKALDSDNMTVRKAIKRNYKVVGYKGV